MKYTVVTGVSTGIGLGTAGELTKHGYHVFGSVRKEEDGERVRSQLGESFTPLTFDVTDEVAIRAAALEVEKAVGEKGLNGLVNNAGIGVYGPLTHLSLDEVRRQMEVNFFGVLAVTQAFLPLLGARKNAPHSPGRIVNISSVSGKIAFPFFGPYSASKHALEAISHTLRRELLLYGIDVILIGPGAVKTPIWDKGGQEDAAGRFSETDYGAILADFQESAIENGKQGLPPEAVGRAIRKALEVKKPKVRYIVVGNSLRDWFIPLYLPSRWLDNLIGKSLGLSKNK